jgi:prophage regulatory protein
VRGYAHVVTSHNFSYIPRRPGLNRGVATSLSQEGLAMTRKLVSKKELKTVYGIPYCFAHIARLEAAGLFPKRLRLGACRVAWYAEEIEEWIDTRPRASAA